MQGTLQVRPCKLDGAIHGANAPAWPTRPTFDSFLPRPTTEKKKEKQKRVARCARSVSTKVDTYQQPQLPVDPRHAWMIHSISDRCADQRSA
ncbi:hypothetical protein, partial [Stenotrophomonas maltophilia]|uniref:hypothetical protein n=2 Tax=Stenotrophomonas maltophilia TaxID=40324 RepID=UPI0019D3ACCC